ncbi:MAG TPA: FtsX-like permease family protein, partial [Cyclobacteriaceae bacterium]|nr:FtsX-like permease family protein [Cyclobacteriaceae bacterium]
KYQTYWQSVSNPKYSWILGGIAVLILIIACVNYISLALAGSTTRRKEVGVRKVTGAQKWQLAWQFGMESLVLTVVSVSLSILLVVLLRTSFNELTGRDINIQLAELSGIAAVMAMLVALLAGSYPAFYLSSLKPALVLKGIATARLQSNFTKGLVALQFALSSFLIVSAVVMNRQMDFITNKDLGFDKEQVIVIPTQLGRSDESNRFIERFRTELQKIAGVIEVSGTSSSFGGGTWRNDIKRGDQVIPAYIYAVDDKYISTLGLELVAGRNFDPALASDSSGIIVNEAMVRAMGWDKPIDEQLKWRGNAVDRVIGVVKDYHFMSLEHAIGPVIMSINKQKVGYLPTMFVKVEAGMVSSSVAQIASTWKSIAPDKPFNYSFLDDDVSRQYGDHKLWTNLMTIATAIGIVIACMGLFGLSGMNAVSRTKEIGIRKALGAELVNIVVMMNKPYLWLAGIAFMIAVPLAAYAMDRWLSIFEFRISIDAMLLVVTMVASLATALLSVSYHAVKAGMMEPGKVLKSE